MLAIAQTITNGLSNLRCMHLELFIPSVVESRLQYGKESIHIFGIASYPLLAYESIPLLSTLWPKTTFLGRQVKMSKRPL